MLSSQPLANESEPGERIVILGIGNELNGDDAAGVLVVRSLFHLGSIPDNLLLIEGGVAPESFTGKIRRFAPRLVVFVDAADFGAVPGTIACLEVDEIDGFSASAHTLPPSVLAGFLVEETGCRVGIVAIQAGHLEWGKPMTEEVTRAVEVLAAELARVLVKGP